MLISVQTIVNMSQNEVMDTFTGKFKVQFSDGVLETNYKEIIYSSYVWEAHRLYPGAPIPSSHNVSSVLNGKRCTMSTHLKLIGRVIWDVYYHASKRLDEISKAHLRDRLAELSYRITNKIYNDMVVNTEEYASSLDILDFHDVLNHPDITEAYSKLPEPTDTIESLRTGIDNVYSAITNVLNDKTKLPGNPLSGLIRSALISEKQLHQCLGPRGFLTDTDSDMFVRPILRGYVDGMRTLYNSLIESRSAAKSLEFSKTPLQDSEYFARRLQLVCMGVENLHREDCGTGRYLRWTVMGEEYNNGIRVYGGDLKNMVGKYYLDKETNTLKSIKATDTHLIGQEIDIRAVMFCRHPDPKGVCSVCYGESADTIPLGSNLGHANSAYMCEKASQNILSTKHLDGSSVIESIILNDGDKYYLSVYKDGNSYTVNKHSKEISIQILIPGKVSDKPVNLTDVYDVEDVRQLVLSRVSEISHIGVIYKYRDGTTDRGDIEVQLDRRLASLTYEFLEYIRNKGWSIDSYGNYVIDIDEWNMEKPILTLPLRHFNMSDHAKAIANIIEGTVNDVYKRDKETPPELILRDLFTLTNRRLSVNMAALEVIQYAAMTVSTTQGNYELPKPWTTAGMGVIGRTMTGRSDAASMAYEGHYEILTSPAGFISTNRPEHPFDMILCPREVTESRSRDK